MRKSTTDRPYEYIDNPDGSLVAPPLSPRILIHTRQGKVASIYCDHPAKILEVEPQDDPWRAVRQAMPAMISPQTSVKVVGGFGTSVAHMLTMAFADPTMDADLRETLAANEIVLGEKGGDGRRRLGLVCATEGDDGLEQRLNTGVAVTDVKKN